MRVRCIPLVIMLAAPLVPLAAQLPADELVLRSIRLGADGPPAGEPDSVTVMQDRATVQEVKVFHYPGLRVELVQGMIGEIVCWAEPCETPRGIGVGDSLDAVRTAYGTEKEPFFDRRTGATWLFLWADDAVDWSLGFRLMDGRVEAIQLGCVPCYYNRSDS